jgi:hypothetical protein
VLWKQERSGFGEEVEILLILIFFGCYEFFLLFVYVRMLQIECLCEFCVCFGRVELFMCV